MSNYGFNRADQWLGSTAPNPERGNIEVRGMDTTRLIDARPSVIVITRRDPATEQTYALPPQRVRIEVQQNAQSAGERRDAMVQISDQYVVLVGNKDNPTISNTDILLWDLFLYQSRMYEVKAFIDTVPGRLLASCELTP